MEILKKKIIRLGAMSLVIFSCSAPKAEQALHFHEAFADKFFIGTALNTAQIAGGDTVSMAVVRQHFNAIVPENCMKSENIQPHEGVFDFELPDKFVAFGEANNMHINGHTLIWHSQTPRWFFVDSLKNDVSREVMIQRMRDHIFTVVGRYKGRVHTWDVVNEAVMDDGTLRPSKFLEIIGEDYLQLAFQFANEADPEAKLYYNDYSMAIPAKREGVVNMVKNLQAAGVQIDGIGMQGHVGLESPSLEEFEKSIVAFSDLGVKVLITEWDMTVLPSPWENTGADIANRFVYRPEMDPYRAGLPADVAAQFNERALGFFKLFVKYQDQIDRVTFWGVNDAQSWKNDWPIKGRMDYTLLFDRNNQPKDVVYEIVALGSKK